MEEIRSIFKKYKNRLVFEGVLKSLLWGAVIGFAVNLIFVAILFITAVDLIWVSAVTCAVIVAATMLTSISNNIGPRRKRSPNAWIFWDWKSD